MGQKYGLLAAVVEAPERAPPNIDVLLRVPDPFEKGVEDAFLPPTAQTVRGVLPGLRIR
ncbi:MAG: hypothetical protein ACYTFI_04235 [Planctomycetota bacterium]